MSTRKMIYPVVRAMLIVGTALWVLSLSCPVYAGEAPGDGARVTRALPADVYPESGFRLPLPKRDDFDEEGKKIFDKRVGTGARSLRGLHGPSGIRLYSPKLAEYLRPVSQYLRFESGFSGRIRELAILVTAREMNSQFEWAAHEAEALKEGLPQEIVDVVKYRKGLEGVPEMESVVIQFGREMLGKNKVESATFARARKIFSAKQLVDLVHLMINYQGTASMLAAFDMQLDPGVQPPLTTP